MQQNAEMTLYVSTVRGKKSNTSYPYAAKITCVEELAKAAGYDHVSAQYKDGKNSRGDIVKSHRATVDFLTADNTCMDCDNKENNPTLPDIPPEQWKTPEDVQAAFPNVAFYIVPSRNNMKVKDGLPARPKFHVYFPHRNPIVKWEQCVQLKQKLLDIFPAFDDGAKDAARFIFGVEDPQPVYYPGELCIDEFIANMEWDRESNAAMEQTESEEPTTPKFGEIITKGNRHTVLLRFANTVLTKYGTQDEKAKRAFIERAGQCEEPLPQSELATIWRDACKHYANVTSQKPGYISPQKYATQQLARSLVPTDYTDVGQATLFSAVYGDKAKYTPATKWLVYDGKVWHENEIYAQGLAQELTEKQLDVARRLLARARAELDAAVEKEDSDAVKDAKDKEEEAMKFYCYVLAERKSSRIAATLTEAKPALHIPVEMLDADPYLLNTPGGTVNLKTGAMQQHNPADYCTKITAVAPGTQGAELFAEFLARITCNDKDLERYLQEVAGMCAVGQVLRENLIIAYGGGGNGKSTLFNLLSRVMGNYGGGLHSDVLITNNRNNKKPEYAELRGKRIVIAAELEEGMRLDTGTVKRLCSTDPIRGEKKFKDAFDFIPSHTVVLYTNHLPKVGTIDKGTWDRLVVVPFNANLRGVKGEILNYADYLFQKAGGAVLAWIVEGARRFVAQGGQIKVAECVKQACEEYRAANDWLHNFLNECCELVPGQEEKSSALYDAYKTYCLTVRDYIRRADDFKQAVENAGFTYRRTKNGVKVYGLRVKTTDFVEVDEPTPWDPVPPL